MNEELSGTNFDRFASAFGDDCLVVGCTLRTDEGIIKIPDFITEDGEIILLSKVEVEAELILRDKYSH